MGYRIETRAETLEVSPPVAAKRAVAAALGLILYAGAWRCLAAARAAGPYRGALAAAGAGLAGVLAVLGVLVSRAWLRRVPFVFSRESGSLARGGRRLCALAEIEAAAVESAGFFRGRPTFGLALRCRGGRTLALGDAWAGTYRPEDLSPAAREIGRFLGVPVRTPGEG